MDVIEGDGLRGWKSGNVDSNGFFRKFVFLCCPPAILMSGYTQDAVADVGVLASLRYVENALQFQGADADDLVRGLAIYGNFSRESERLFASLSYSANKEDYKNNLQRDRSYIQGTGLLEYRLVPDVLSWQLSNTRLNTVQDLSQPDNPDNQQVVDITRTGPTLTFPVSSATLLVLALEYSEADYERSGRIDQQNKTATSSLSHEFSQVLTGSINASYAESEFRDSGLAGYDISTISLVTDFDYDSLTLSLEVGTQNINTGAAGNSSDTLKNATVEYQLNSRSSVSLRYRDAVVDQLRNLTLFGAYYTYDFESYTQSPVELGSTNLYGLYSNVSVTTSYSYEVDGRFNFQLGYSDNERNYGTGRRDEASESLFANFGIPLSDRAGLNFSARFAEFTYSQFDSSRQERQTFFAGFDYRSSDNLSFRFSVTDLDQDSQDDLTNFEDFTAFLSVSYRFLGF